MTVLAKRVVKQESGSEVVAKIYEDGYLTLEQDSDLIELTSRDEIMMFQKHLADLETEFTRHHQKDEKVRDRRSSTGWKRTWGKNPNA